ncbi:Efflux pump membrane transporter BepE [Thiorhodovibrio winogradskyi]|uniref:Efflux pump membrane transporter BepE n=1 Tax=Thiorhodovibrio winogradskyi TaxID=77007 RepID=A0ABZ0SBS1_9GAMM|nr:efflux RND transporter permease subunit [Thiorhodovibrio winogradskyi]
MRLTTFAVTRPVAASVLSLLIVLIGTAAVLNLPVREYPNVDDPTVTVAVRYPGASAAVVEREVGKPIEEAVSGIDGVRQIRVSSRDGRARIEVEFSLDRDLDLAAVDVRERVGAVRDTLPDQADAPRITQRSLNAQVVMWLVLTSETLDRLQLSDLAERHLVESLSTVPGVARVLFGGERRYALRIHLDVAKLSAHGLTVLDVERALRARNLELPAGRLVSEGREMTLRTLTELKRPEAFRELILSERDGALIRLGEVAEIEYGPETERTAVRLDGEPGIGLGIVRQSGANLVAVSHGVRAKLEQLQARLPEAAALDIPYDAATFVEASIRQILYTLALTIGLVIAVVFVALGSWRATLVPALTLPASVVGAFILLWALGFSINVLTLLALILAIGLLVDDAIVVGENVFRFSEQGKPRLLAADLGAGEVAFAVIATTTVLLAVIAPLGFLGGDAGRLFGEFAAGLGGALALSSVVALTAGVSVAARLIDAERIADSALRARVGGLIERLGDGYLRLLGATLKTRWLVLAVALGLLIALVGLYRELPRELSPREDRGAIFIPVNAPEGTTLSGMLALLDEIEGLTQPLLGPDGPGRHVISLVAPRSEGQGPVNSGIVILKLKDWDERALSQFEVTEQLQPKLASVAGAQAFAINPPSLGGGSFEPPVQMALTGADLEEVHALAQQVLAEAREMPRIAQARLDYQPSNPQLRLEVDRERAAALGVSLADIGRSLRILMGGEDITDFSIDAETYEVMVRAREADRAVPEDLERIEVRAQDGTLVRLSGLIDTELVGRAAERMRIDRRAAVTLKASLAGGAALGDVLDELEARAKPLLPADVEIRWLSVSQDYQRSAQAFLLAFTLALGIVYLVLAAQFESFIQPVVLLAGVPLALLGALMALWLGGGSINLYAQIGFILAIGLMAKNAILLVEFVNQLRDRGEALEQALTQAARVRFRPILMTSIATLFGALPLALAVGPGAESRRIIGLTIVGGILAATVLTLFLVPVLYRLIARRTRARAGLARELARQRDEADAPSVG